MDFVSKYMYDFEVYCRRSAKAHKGLPLARGATNIVYAMVIGFLAGLEGQEHCLMMDNLFCSIFLFRNLVEK